MKILLKLPPFTLNNSGFTILESLVGMLVASLLLAAITPVLVMSTAIRVQARRVELATQAARTFIDGVRIGSVTAPTIVSQISANTDTHRNLTISPNDYLITTTEMPAPTSATDLYCYNQNGIISSTDCVNNLFYIQAGRIVQSTQKNDGYRLAIRVYRADIDFSKTIKINTGATSRQTASPVTAGLGDKQAPLMEMTTEIANTRTTFQALCQRLGTPLAAPTPTATPTPVSCR
ncbi:type II secretion system protein [Anabaena sphaerica FACHB-251]|uniref:Type II secretion system protein n=1 Tax=Anabaena sphaerica FACHB-251 TaxID=2692883 RepID=A0A926WFI3_9NOST|nr:hormogonium polysaccharide secretion pseudopilin HpsB [Anabaena sphaerica]MBD2293553.1 type II secretion system protein [Anabaena sphaerica FACHB-251]